MPDRRAAASSRSRSAGGAPRGLSLCRILIAAHSGLAKRSGFPELGERGGLAEVVGDEGDHRFGTDRPELLRSLHSATWLRGVPVSSFVGAPSSACRCFKAAMT